ncbi:MAG: ATP-dependent helicase, partial [Actinobacteria bacterium]|nr:ATP-dependent helicase [Actinomycetota bacterium]
MSAAVKLGQSVRFSADELSALLHLPTTPTPEQAAVIEAPLAPAVVIAGAGSGKTETMSARVVWLVANGLVRPDEVLGLTFTRKAADQLGTRIRRRLGQWRRVVEQRPPDERAGLAELLAGEPTVLTYAAYAGRLVAEHALRVGAESNPRVLSPASRWQLADAVVRRFTGSLPAGIGALSSIPRYVLQLADQLADHLVNPDAVTAFCERLLAQWEPLPPGKNIRAQRPGSTAAFIDATEHRRELMALVRDFAAGKRGAVDFGDQMALATQLAGSSDVVAIERGRFRAVLLDEYQDTGHAQIVTLAALFGDGHPVTAVGDPFQSIYGWRGASAGNIGRFARVFVDVDGTPAAVFPLSTSWRNDEIVLSAANTISAPLRSTAFETIELRARPGAGAGRLSVARLATNEDEARWLAEELDAIWRRSPVGDRTAAVLVRRRAQIPLLADALRARGLPVDVVGLGGLLISPEVADVVATLRVLADHRPTTALMRILTGARWRIGVADLKSLHRRARALSHRPGTDSAQSSGLLTTASESASDQPGVDDAGLDDANLDDANLVEALDDLGDPASYSSEGYRRLAELAAEFRYLRRRVSAPLADLVAD